MPPAGSTGLRYVLQLLFCEKNAKKSSMITNAGEKISTYLESLEFWKCFDACLTEFLNNQIAS
jgi:hypothetical protein